jgi:serine/threonine protein kinase
LADFGTAENIAKKKWAISPSDAVKYMSPELIGLYHYRDNRFANDKLAEVKERIKGRRVIFNDSTLVALNKKQKALARKIRKDRREFSAAADVWPLGPVVYELFCGELSSERIAAARGDGGKEPRPLKLQGKGIFTHQDVRDALNMLILNVMKHDPKDRWSIDQVSDFFDQHLSQFLPE